MLLWICEFILEDFIPWAAVVGGAIIVGLWANSDNVCAFVGRYAC